METLTQSELKSLCQQRKLPVSGNKSELIERLTKGATLSRSSSGNISSGTSNSASSMTTSNGNSSSSSGAVASALFPSDYDALMVSQLKELCRERLLPVGGIKDDLVARLNASDPRKMSSLQLKEKCREAGLPVTGTKPDLAERVMKSMSSGTAALLQTKTMDELKDLCREQGVTVTGRKDELVERIKQANSTTTGSSSTGAATLPQKKKKTPAAPVLPAYDSLTVPQLKEICRGRGLPVGGTKDELVARINSAVIASSSLARPSSATASTTTKSTTSSASSSATSGGGSITSSGQTMTTTPSYDSMTTSQLKDLCRGRTLPLTGVKDELVKRLQTHDDVVRTMFKKRKATPTSTGPSSTGPSSTGSSKRPATAIDEQPAKKIKMTARKSTGSGSVLFGRRPAPDNVATKRGHSYLASAGMAVTEKTIKKTKTKTKAQAPSSSSSSGRYIVYSMCAYPADGWHSYAGPGQRKYDRSYDSVQAANGRVNELFYQCNPWGVSQKEMDDYEVDEHWDPHNGLLRLEVCPPDSEQWVVSAMDRGTTASGDADVVMISDGEEDEDEDETEDKEQEQGFSFGGYAY